MICVKRTGVRAALSLFLIFTALSPLSAFAAEAPAATPPPESKPAKATETGEPTMPQQIADMVRIAQEEAIAANKETMPRNNKYTVWYFGDQRKVGWCSNFVSWCANEAGISLLKDDDAVPMPDDAVFVTNEAKVPNTFVAYNLAERITDIPRPGYEVIYGVIGSTPYTHVGIVETVKDLGDGVYELTTIEGNVSNTVKRYCYRYHLNPKVAHRNFKAVPAEEQTRDDAQYKLHKENWYITGFGQTWK